MSIVSKTIFVIVKGVSRVLENCSVILSFSKGLPSKSSGIMTFDSAVTFLAMPSMILAVAVISVSEPVMVTSTGVLLKSCFEMKISWFIKKTSMPGLSFLIMSG